MNNPMNQVAPVRCQNCCSVTSIFRTSRYGSLCPACYKTLFPYKEAGTFGEVLANGDDQVLVRDLLKKYVPDTIQQKILREFNDIMWRKD